MKPVIASLFALLTAACGASIAQPVVGLDPSDPAAPVPPLRTATALGTYVSQRPVAPAPWREQNERVAPRREP